MQAPSPEKLPKGFGSFSLSIDAQRTILPGVALSDFAAYTLDFAVVSGGTTKTEDRTSANLTSSPVILAVGTYNLTIRAYKDADKTRLAARGTEFGIVIEDGAAISKTVTLKALGDEGSGTFTWNINITASDVTSASMAISRNGTASGSPVTLNLSGATAGSRTLNSGKYNVTFTLIKNDVKEEAVWNEILYVYAELTSDFTFTFDNDFFYQTHYTVTFVYNDDGVTSNAPQSVMHGAALTKPPDPSKPLHAFAGWHTDSSLNDPYVFTTLVYNDFSLYAKWEWDIYVAVATFAGATADMIIKVPHNITMGDNITIPANSGRTLTITSESSGPYTISRGRADTTANSGLFIVGSNTNLILQDIILDGNKTTYTTNTMPLVRINGGTFTLKDGAVLRNNRASEGGAVYISSGTFTMNGGDITGNTATNRGGGVYVYSTFTMNGGKINSNNCSSTSSSNGGGGVYVHISSTFNLIDGEIFENTATSNGGGVNNYYGTFTMSGGKITGNNATGNGGGVYNRDTFNMSGGEITGNKATTNGGGVYNDSAFTMTAVAIIGGSSPEKANNAANGGGVYNNDTFNMRGGEITGNTVTSNGGGVYNNRTFTVGGASKVNGNTNNGDASLNNVHIATYHFITLGTGSYIPSGSMEIYINASGGTGNIVVRSGAKTGDEAYFKTDDPLKSVLFDSIEGYLYIDEISLTLNQLDFYAQVAAYAYAADDVTITVNPDLTLPIPVEVPANSAGKTLTIKGNTASRILKRDFLASVSSDGLFILGSSNAKLIFENIIVDGDKNTHTTNTSPLVQVNGGTLTMGAGAVLRNNRASSGAAVYVNSGTFTMNNGEITGNTATSNGGGVYNSSTFTMNGGEIYSNNSSSNGGGVYSSGTFTMNGGKIYSNNSSSGGGVYATSGTFTMNNGEITDNTATSNGGGVNSYSNSTFTMNNGKISDNKAANGGGVYNYYSSSSNSNPFTMSGGKITGNTATSNGGGVYNYYYTSTNSTTGVTTIYNSTFNMSGGEISGNGAATNGGGVYNDSIFNLGGTAVIKENIKTGDSSKNNVYLTNGKYITIGNGVAGTGNVPAPASGMEVYITNPSANGSTIVSSGATAADAAYFHTDGGTTTVAYQATGRLVLVNAYSGNVNITFIVNDQAPGITGNLTIYRSNNISGRPASVTVTATGSGFTNPRWYWNGNLLSSGNSVTLNVNDPLYDYGNLIGEKFLTLEATAGGKPYSRTISFRVEP